jgi:hypothetical protein
MRQAPGEASPMIPTGLRELINRLRFRFWMLRDALSDTIHGTKHREGIFGRIYRGNEWGDRESVSGAGSNEAATRAVRRELPLLLQRYGIRSLLDAPCGDFRWMREVVGALDRYIGVDIVADLIERNTRFYATHRVSFLRADIATDPLPTADLILCRDCFIHLPTRLIHRTLRNFQTTGARYLLLTNDGNAEPYHDIPIGSFRRINFTRPPFLLGEPTETISESASGDRQLCLWRLQELPR